MRSSLITWTIVGAQARCAHPDGRSEPAPLQMRREIMAQLGFWTASRLCCCCWREFLSPRPPGGGRRGQASRKNRWAAPVPQGKTMFVQTAPETTGIRTENRYADPKMRKELYQEFETSSIGTGVAIETMMATAFRTYSS